MGKPVERGYSLLPWATLPGHGYEFAASFLSHVWSKGVDVGSDKGTAAEFDGKITVSEDGTIVRLPAGSDAIIYEQGL